jgi:capsular exopolysaccharide synthesis family protein
MDTQAQLIQVTSPAAGDGKTTTVANLAIAFANAGDRVLVVSCDLRQPKLHELFGLDNSVGFTSVVIGETSLAGAVQASPTFDNVSVLPSGPKPTNPSEMLSSSRTGELFASFRTRWDVVLIDSPPILPVSDALGMANFVDSIILVGAAGKSTQRSVRRAVDSLRLVGAPLECAILNKEAGHEADEYGYGYGYGEPRGRASLRRSTSEQAAVVGGTS